ncbi:TasA family protein [Modestobacter sp. NPDC049651]|uniref:TasA family protein n=1 Tax=unclassified Modestobacter TaxID=2643866 RepID=UPI0033E02F2F
MTATKTAKARTTRKILGSLGVLGAAAAVAGLGTFGTFTDSTTPVDAQVATGTLAIDLNAANSTAALPLTAAGFVPGDSLSRTYDLVNTGNLGFAGISMTTTAPVSSVLDTDRTNGLQLSVQSCATSWTETKLATGGATYACAAPTALYNGPAVAAGKQLAGLSSLTAGRSDHLMVTLSLPTTADNGFMGKSSTLSLAFSGTQAAGAAR